MFEILRAVIPKRETRSVCIPRALPLLLVLVGICPALPAGAAPPSARPVSADLSGESDSLARMMAANAPAGLDGSSELAPRRTGHRSHAQRGSAAAPLVPAPVAAATPALGNAVTVPVQSTENPPPVPAAVSAGLSLDAGSGRVVTLSAPAANVFVADPKVAEVRPASSTSLFIFGIAPGRTTVAALDGAGHPIAQYDVTVRPSAFGASEAAAAIARALPGHGIRVRAELKALVLSGQVSTAEESQRAATIASAYLTEGQTVDNQITVMSSIQVGLRVRIAEMSRSVTRALGVNWTALGTIGRTAILFQTGNALASFASSLGAGATLNITSKNLDAVFQALAQDNLARVLAEPTLTAMSGQVASFLVGGEFPIPVAQQNNTTTIEFKQYGIALGFVPTVLSDGRINLHVRPEVSQLTDQGAITTGSITVPALTVRRAETSVELGSGQSFAIAGLLQDQVSHNGFGVIELGLLWWTKNALQATAALTARCAGLGACQCAAGACTPAQFAVETASAWLVTGVIGTADVTISSSVACNGTPQTTYTSAAITSRFWASGSLPPPFPSTAISVSACFPTSTFN